MAKVEFKRVENDEQVQAIDIVDGQLIYSKSGKTYMDYGNERIATGSGGGGSTEVYIQEEEPTEEDAKIWVDTDEVQNIGSEVVDSLSGNQSNMAPSVRAVKGTVLYTGSTEGNVSLSDNASNYDYIEIYYDRYGSNSYVKVYSPQNKEVVLDMQYLSGDYMRFYTRTVKIQDTSITTIANCFVNIKTSTKAIETVGTTASNISISRVVGYK